MRWCQLRRQLLQGMGCTQTAMVSMAMMSTTGTSMTTAQRQDTALMVVMHAART